ncbi:ATP-dependent DNA helicase PIF1 [Lecanosticta acicola]|uniref:ATP-dependent DNA helicase n=1 Tax=Lecanosticta acicola TaxID=111012 RepID=A0AAI8Z7L6_9PEZI|nr:ATP-dependent DNA helicase PIF1 [Lecanosticta acicola]
MATIATNGSDLVSYIVPGAPHLGVAPHSGALVVVPDGLGGVKSYGWFTAACCRIISQDSTQLELCFKQGLLSFSVFEKACKHLGATCGAPDVQTWQERLSMGSSIMQQYTSISAEEQLIWLKRDVEFRKSFQPTLQSSLQSVNAILATSQFTNPQEQQFHSDSGAAICALIQLNDQQIAHIKDTQSKVLAILPGDTAAKLAGPCYSAPGRNVPAPGQSSTLQPAVERPPLVPISANANHSMESGFQNSETLKRRREDEAPKAKSEVISLLEESDDEDALQGQADALNAKIAAIRARTAHEDQLVPSKKPKTRGKAIQQPQPSEVTAQLSVVSNTPQAGQSAEPEWLPKPPLTATNRFDPNERKLEGNHADGIANASQFACISPQESSRASAGAMEQPQPSTGPSTATRPSVTRTKLKLRTQGHASVWIEPSNETRARKVIQVGKAQFKISTQQSAHLVFRGQRLDPDQRIGSLHAKDCDAIDLIVSNRHTDALKSQGNACSAQKIPASKNESIPPPAPPTTLSLWFEDNSVRFSRLPDCLSKQGKHLFRGSSQAASENASPAPALASPAPATPVPATPQPVIDLTSGALVPPDQPQPAPRNEPVLCQEQQEVVDLILAGKNVFYTGSAGCGKSTVLKSFVPKLRELGKEVRIVAPTGKAALDINGSTTWTFAGWTPLHMKKPLVDLRKAAHGTFVRRRLVRTDVLVIDEISMVENHMLERLSAIMKEARGDDRAFGGVQLVVTGDFCQLPPVKPFQHCITCGREQPRRMAADGRVVYRCPQHGDRFDDDKWAFRSAAWEECKFKHINLTNIHRQSDEVFIKILQKLRVGSALTQADRELLMNHTCNIDNAVKLFPTRNEVMRINQSEFDKLTTAKLGYTCLDHFRWNEEKHPHLRSKGDRQPYDNSLIALREHRMDNFVELRKDMLVVLLVNLDIKLGLVNGSQGKIVDFEPYDPAKLPKASRDSGGIGSSSKSARPGYSSTQRSRGRRDGSMEPPESYESGELRGEYAALRETQIREFILQDRNKSKMWPVVEFDNGLRRTIYAECTVNELGDVEPGQQRDYTLLARTQIPLVAAWAMTIHKSQGMTLNRVMVDLGKSFEEGQEYVALSRARALDGLKVLSLGDGVGKGGNAQVKQFLWEKFKLR